MYEQVPDPEDVRQNKGIAIIAYFVFFVPLIAAKDSVYARYHANQGLILLLLCIAIAIVQSFLSAIFFAAFTLASLPLLALLGVIFTLLYIAAAVLGVLGIVNAAQGRMKPMPLIGSLFTFIH